MEYKAEVITKEEYEVIARGSFEAKKEQVEKEPVPEQETTGKAIQKLREENSMERDVFASMALINPEELEKIESGEQKPDQDTLELIGNFFRVYPSELAQGRIVEMKSREDILAVMNGVADMLKKVKEDTGYFKGFIQKWELEELTQNLPASNLTELPEAERYQALEEDKTKADTEYVILDTETGELLPERYEQMVIAQKEAEWLNWKDQNPEIHIEKDAFQQIRTYERSVGQTQTRVQQMTPKEIEKYVTDTARHLQFGKQIDLFLAGKLNLRDAIHVCDTPVLFQDAGCKPLPMHITQRHLRQCMHPEELGHPEYHGLTIAQIKRLPEFLENPAMLMESLTREESIVVVSSQKDQKNRPIIISIKREGHASYGLEAVQSNFITSVYGRSGFVPFLERVIEENKLLYISTQKSKELALVPVQFRHDHPDLCFDTIIRKVDMNVNENSPVLGAEPTIPSTKEPKI